MDNKKVAEVFTEIGNILEIQGENFFKVNAYRKAALTVENFAQDFRKLVKETPVELNNIPGIGKALKEKIIELVETGQCEYHQKLKAGFPAGLLEMLKLRAVGPKKVKLFYTQLAIKTIDELKAAAEKGLLRDLPKMGEKSETEILKAIEEFSQFSQDRTLIHDALEEAEAYIEYMRGCPEIEKIQYAGSLRRAKESIGDIDILVTVKDTEASKDTVMGHFVSYAEVMNVIAEGDTKSSVILESGIQVDLRVLPMESFGAALHYFTGSKDHNIKMRDIAKKRGMKVNEYGLFEGDKMLAGETEEEMFKQLDLPWIPPEMRQNKGEFEYAIKHGKVPNLIQLEDIRGDLHNHSNYSDGKNTIIEMAEAFAGRGYEYFAMTDHSAMMGVTGGMGVDDINRQWKEIDELNEDFAGRIRILKGCEVDILKDGSLDFGDEVLKELDVVIISAHMHNRLSAEEQTTRLIRAIENPYSRILGHPTGRLINQRPEMEFDMEKVIEACIENGVILEINSNPKRLDLAGKYVRIAKDMGAIFAINTDAHSLANQAFMKFGVGVARRGWLEAEDVINTYSLKELLKVL
jgi:DNA polymerase (family X)